MSTPYHELKSICSVQDKRCTRCNKCVLQCAFLKEYGTPGDIAIAVQNLPPGQWPNAYECSLCGLCGAVCPEAINPEELFLGMRRVREGNGELDLKPYGAVLKFEGRGNSEQYSLLRVPTGGDTILFPGCGMSATRSKTVRRLFEALQKELPQLGIGLGCCLKPSHDLGRVTFFEEQFGRLLDKLINTGVKRVITTCPNCQKVFAMYGGDIETVTAYEILEEIGYIPDKLSGGDVIVHDPCPQRYDRVSQDAVRSLAERASMKVISSVDQRDMTRCCGEGAWFVVCVLSSQPTGRGNELKWRKGTGLLRPAPGVWGS